jgi:hypothetical protein
VDEVNSSIGTVSREFDHGCDEIQAVVPIVACAGRLTSTTLAASRS